MAMHADESVETLFRKAFRRLAATVTVLTYTDPTGQPCGMTATSICSVSVSPPTLLACVNRSSKTREHIHARGRFAVNFLASAQQDVSNICSRAGGDKVLPRAWVMEPADEGAPPVLRAALAHLDCDVVRVHEESTHSIFVGQARRILLGEGGDPLVYFDGTYCALESKAEASFDMLWERFSSAFL